MPSLVSGLDIEIVDAPEPIDSVAEEGYDVSIGVGDKELTPVHVSKYGGDSIGKSTTLHGDCGNTATRSNGATGFQITLEGILTLEQLRKARELRLHKGVEITLFLQPWVESYIVDDFTWDKPSDLNKWYSPEYPDGVEAFSFQLMTKDPTEGQ